MDSWTCGKGLCNQIQACFWPQLLGHLIIAHWAVNKYNHTQLGVAIAKR